MFKYEVKRINNILHGPKINLKIDNRGVGRYLFDKFVEHDDKTCQINSIDGEEQTYKHVNTKCIRVALAMKERGVQKNDVILICSSNNMDSVVPLLATIYVNAITVTLDPSISLRDTTHLLKIIRPKMIFVEESAIALIESALNESTFETELVVIGDHDEYLRYAEFLKPNADENTFIPDDVENIRDTGVIFFSSGTTGLPKGIELSHYALIYMTDVLINAFPKYDSVIHFTSFYWMTAVLLTFLVIRNGARKVVIKNFEPEIALPCIQKYKISNIFLAPAQSYKITEEWVSKYPCPGLQLITLGGSSISYEQMKKLRAYFPHCSIYLTYAQTETGGLISCFSALNITEKLKEKLTCSGLPIINTNIKIVDLETEKVLGPNEKGEIRVLIPSVCNGYYRQDSSNMLDEDGYVKTGDIGYYDDENCLYVCDRIKDMFKYQSWHIVPLSLENVISEHPAVREALVIGIPSEADGHIPMALVVLRKNEGNVSEDDLLKFSNDRLSEREQLRGGLKIIKDLPKGTTGKVSRKHITDLVVGGQLHKLVE